MGIGTQASVALALATAPQRRVWQGGSEAERERGARVVRRVASGGIVLSGAWVIFTILDQRWDFYRFSTSLLISVLLPFYVKTAELLHYPHPMAALDLGAV